MPSSSFAGEPALVNLPALRCHQAKRDLNVMKLTWKTTGGEASSGLLSVGSPETLGDEGEKAPLEPAVFWLGCMGHVESRNVQYSWLVERTICSPRGRGYKEAGKTGSGHPLSYHIGARTRWRNGNTVGTPCSTLFVAAEIHATARINLCQLRYKGSSPRESYSICQGPPVLDGTE